MLSVQAQAKVSADIVEIDSELVRCLLCHALLPCILTCQLSPCVSKKSGVWNDAQCFNVALREPLAEDEAATLAWCGKALLETGHLQFASLESRLSAHSRFTGVG